MSVVKELDLVSTETIKMLVFGLKASLSKYSCPPEGESIVDKSDHRPDDEQGDDGQSVDEEREDIARTFCSFPRLSGDRAGGGGHCGHREEGGGREQQGGAGQ